MSFPVTTSEYGCYILYSYLFYDFTRFKAPMNYAEKKFVFLKDS